MTTITSVAVNELKNQAAKASPADREKLLKNVREFVGQTYFGTLMKQMRSEMNPDNPLNGGKAGQTFRAQLDQTLISRWAESSRFEVADKIARDWTGIKASSVGV
jgi:Rod binding domain-containing protein